MLKSCPYKVLFGLFLISGFCGLLYQVVWLRLAFASFGVVTGVLSVVLSIFMAGLFSGSWFAGQYVDFASSRKISPIFLYGVAEALVGVGAFAVPYLFNKSDAILMAAGDLDSFRYLSLSAFFIAGSLFPWCFFMGTTFPLVMAYVKRMENFEKKSFSFLYLANVIGAMLGTVITSLFLIELLGFSGTLRVAAALNGLIALVSFGLTVLSREHSVSGETASPVTTPRARSHRPAFVLTILFLTGFSSMAMEVVWTRAFTPVLKTQVYSFALLLAVYLLSTWLGSLAYRRHVRTGKVWSIQTLLGWIGATSLLPLLMGDPRLNLNAVGVLVSIAPFSWLLGYLTPRLIDDYSDGFPDAAGNSYALNVFGCILGPLFASYLLLPFIGVKGALLVLTVPFFVLIAYECARHENIRELTVGGVGALLLIVAFTHSITYEERWKGFDGGGEVRRDHTATVIAYGKDLKKQLLVNGVGITFMTTITKLMAHMPLGFHTSTEPKSALAICFGMGTTFRSFMTWGINVVAVELVPSVKDSFPYFYDDAKEILRNPMGRIVVDDGRRFLRRSREKFDVVTLDPPPPVEAAGSSLLYSKEFYDAVKDRLNQGGILQQWFPGTTDSVILNSVTTSIKESFPYVRMFRSFEGWGYHYLASMQPIPNLSPAEFVRRLPEKSRKDLMEWTEGSPVELVTRVFAGEVNPDDYLSKNKLALTDDRPVNEYFVLRRIHWTKPALAR